MMVWLPPHTAPTIFLLAKPGMAIGVVTFALSALPSCPYLPCPKLYTPLSKRIREIKGHGKRFVLERPEQTFERDGFLRREMRTRGNGTVVPSVEWYFHERRTLFQCFTNIAPNNIADLRRKWQVA